MILSASRACLRMLELKGRSQEYESGAVFGFDRRYGWQRKLRSRMPNPRPSSRRMRSPHVEIWNGQPDAVDGGIAVCDELRSGRARQGPGKSRRRQEPVA